MKRWKVGCREASAPRGTATGARAVPWRSWTRARGRIRSTTGRTTRPRPTTDLDRPRRFRRWPGWRATENSGPTALLPVIRRRGGPEYADGKDPLRFNNWMKRSATGAVLTGITIGLQRALEDPRKQPPFVIVASDEPGDPDGPIDLRFDPDSPADTVAVIRRPTAGEDGTTRTPSP